MSRQLSTTLPCILQALQEDTFFKCQVRMALLKLGIFLVDSFSANKFLSHPEVKKNQTPCPRAVALNAAIGTSLGGRSVSGAAEGKKKKAEKKQNCSQRLVNLGRLNVGSRLGGRFTSQT